MIGKINMYGRLKIQRVGRLSYQLCPHRQLSNDEDPAVAVCDDQCPLFGEPEEISPTETRLEICQGKVLKFSELIDERE